ncbi:MAG: GGDEF domain-containing protein [Candidatus Deferrimicrobiaceae bacterium]
MKGDRATMWILEGKDSRAASVVMGGHFPYPVDVASDPAAASLIDRLARDPSEVLLLEDSFPFQRTKQFLKMTEETQNRPVIIVLARNITVPASVSLMEKGVFTIVSGEYTAEQAASAVSRSLANRRAFEKIMKMSDSLRQSKGTIETLNAKVAADRDRLAKVNEELNFLLRLATSLHEDPDLDGMFEGLCGDLSRFVPYYGVELLSLVGVPTLRTCSVTGGGRRTARPGMATRERTRIRRLLEYHGVASDGPEPIRKEFTVPGVIPAAAGGSDSNRSCRWETPLSLRADLGMLSVNLPKVPTEDVKRLLRSVAAQLSLFLHNTMEREKVHEMASHDGLTGLFNFRSFNEIFRREFERYLRYDRNLALIMIDLDNFKKVNDTFGHQVGDKVLRMVAGVIQGNLRKTDYGFRYGGDEFIVLLPDRGAWDAEILARRILAAVKKQVCDVPPLRFPLSVSIGISDCGAIASREGEELLKRTDGALYKAKEAGRDRIEVAEPVETQPADKGKCDALV